MPFTATTLDQPLLYERLMSKGLVYELNVWAAAIDDRSVSIYNLYSGERSRLPGVDAVVLMTGRRSNADLYCALRDSGLAPIRIGDCVAPRTLDHAVYEGYVAGLELADGERFIREGQLEDWAIQASALS